MTVRMGALPVLAEANLGDGQKRWLTGRATSQKADRTASKLLSPAQCTASGNSLREIARANFRGHSLQSLLGYRGLPPVQ